MPNAGNALVAGPDTAAFRAAMGCFPTGVTLLTRGSGPSTRVMTVNSLTSLSLDPLLISVSVTTDGRMRPLVEQTGSYAVNVLSESHRELAGEFARRDRPDGVAAMLRCGAVEGITGNAVVPDAVASFECLLHAVHPAGDHVLLIGRVVALHGGAAGSRPLLFHQGSFSRLPQPEEDR
ncbi:flavin reductase family protein [Streptomyces sp. ACA25]|uniref:flavin reductase family protein n=1 Tax=Streptomyces sp. ACA25 TaxID=3022596 RepID=UPI002306F98B|nr:flavin reductase family protein [Streptomyces sp. ACA25]MDB1089545.1 flavin reductase family protein [Streptomyces sp. ACA25]